jgi:hypothetical protein
MQIIPAEIRNANVLWSEAHALNNRLVASNAAALSHRRPAAAILRPFLNYRLAPAID